MSLRIAIVLCLGIATSQAVVNNPCNGTGIVISGTGGTISSPNYPSNYDDNTVCAWRIKAPDDWAIEVRFGPTFGIEYTGNACPYDYIYFVEPDLRRCGSIAPQSLLFQADVLTVYFISDGSIALNGFSFTWTAVDTSTIPVPKVIELSGSQGQISSPSYPNNYGAFLDYTWKVNTLTGKNYTVVEFAQLFDTEKSHGCIYDYVTISETNPPATVDDQILLCAYTEKRVFLSDIIYIKFKSDSTGSGAGFSLNFTSTEPLTCNGVTQQIGSSGIIATPFYPNRYPHNMNCTWQVMTPENTVIAVRFNTNFSLVDDVDCSEEYLQVFDGPNSSSVQFGHNFCGIRAPRSFVTTGNALTVRFVSSSESDFNKLGFLISWTAEVKCKGTEFTCWDGSCIHESLKCDNKVDCHNDVADEASCAVVNTNQCGISEIKPVFKWHSRIVGGYDAVKGSWPWQGHVVIVRGSKSYFVCGAVLINNRWVLTAAHCVTPGVDRTIITFGDHDLNDLDPTAQQTMVVERTFLHPEYNYIDEQGFVDGYDIALFYLASPVIYTKWVKPVCLPDYEVKDGDDVILTGWGLTKFGGQSASRFLQQVVAPVQSREECAAKLQRPNYSDSLICAGLPYGGASTCSGDSGGPALALQNGSWVVAGLTSYGSACGESVVPGSYANVYNLLPYINEVMEIGPKEITLVEITISGQTSGSIQSPNYGTGKYPGGVHRRWEIIVGNGTLIQVRFNETFRIHQYAEGTPCGGDYLLIYGGSSSQTGNDQVNRTCGYSPPLDIESQSNILIVEFYSDYNFEDSGFSIDWNVVAAETTSTAPVSTPATTTTKVTSPAPMTPTESTSTAQTTLPSSTESSTATKMTSPTTMTPTESTSTAPATLPSSSESSTATKMTSPTQMTPTESTSTAQTTLPSSSKSSTATAMTPTVRTTTDVTPTVNTSTAKTSLSSSTKSSTAETTSGATTAVPLCVLFTTILAMILQQKWGAEL